MTYECEDCTGCPYAEKCKKTSKNRTIRVNEELTSMHQEVVENLESIRGALLRIFGFLKIDFSAIIENCNINTVYISDYLKRNGLKSRIKGLSTTPYLLIIVLSYISKTNRLSHKKGY